MIFANYERGLTTANTDSQYHKKVRNWLNIPSTTNLFLFYGWFVARCPDGNDSGWQCQLDMKRLEMDWKVFFVNSGGRVGPQGTSLESHYCLSLLCLLLLLEGKSWNRIGSFAPQNSDSSSPLGCSQSLFIFCTLVFSQSSWLDYPSPRDRKMDVRRKNILYLVEIWCGRNIEFLLRIFIT